MRLEERRLEDSKKEKKKLKVESSMKFTTQEVDLLE